MKMNCIILDDEPMAIEILERYLSKTPVLNLLSSFRDPTTAVQYINDNKVDLIFLDINLPDISGLMIPSLIDRNTLFIFTTAYPEHALQGYELNAVDYLLKPILFERFLKAVIKAGELYKLKAKYEDNDETIVNIGKVKQGMLFFKSGTQIYKVETEDILYFQKEGVYFVIYTKSDKKIIIRTNFASLIEILPINNFIRIHKSYIISLKHIDVITNDEVIINKTHIPISDTYKEDFLKVITNK
jgi:two-component system, LytTR family, response regulator